MKKLICWLRGHKYRLLRNITTEVREMKCDRCAGEFAMNDGIKSVLPLDAELRELHESMRRDHIKQYEHDFAQVKTNVATYNQLLKEARVLQNKLELSNDQARKAALDKRIKEKVAALNILASGFPKSVLEQTGIKQLV